MAGARLTRRLAQLAVASAIATFCGPARAQQSALAPSDIAAAIAWGSSGQALPYLLKTSAEVADGHQQRSSEVVLGAVYTPFVRVALAAKAAHIAHREFTAADVGNLMDPVIIVAFRWYCCDEEHGRTPETFNPFEPFDYRIALPGEPLATRQRWRVTTAPIWVRRDPSLLESLNSGLPTLPYKDVVLVAAYPLSLLSGPTDLIIYREGKPPMRSGVVEIRVGRITAKELRDWR